MDIAPVTKRNRSARYGCQRARGRRLASTAPHHPRPRRRPGGPGGTRGEALVLSDAETGSFGGAWNAKRNRVRRGPRADVVLRARRRPRAANAPSSKRNRTARYGCQRARGLRPSCHPRSARRPSWFAANCALLTRAHARRPACVAPTRALLTRAHAPRIQRRAIDSRPLTRRAFRPTQDAGPKGRVARGAKPSCSLTWRPALSVARGMRNAMGVSVSRGKSAWTLRR